jgi:hypothetical protein
MGKIAVAALVGGLIVFACGALFHMATPLGMAGLSVLPDEGATIEGLRVSVPKTGFYVFPAEGMVGKTSEAEQKAWAEKYRRGPSGMLLYKAEGSEPLAPRQLVTELVTDVLASFFAALVVSMIAAPYLTRVLAVLLLELFAFSSLSLSYWNWYGFPGAYIGAELVMDAITWLLAGLAIARLAPGRVLPSGRAAAAA